MPRSKSMSVPTTSKVRTLKRARDGGGIASLAPGCATPMSAGSDAGERSRHRPGAEGEAGEARNAGQERPPSPDLACDGLALLERHLREEGEADAEDREGEAGAEAEQSEFRRGQHRLGRVLVAAPYRANERQDRDDGAAVDQNERLESGRRELGRGADPGYPQLIRR